MSCMKCLSKCPYSKTPVLPPKISICVPVTFSLTFHPNFHPNILVFANLPIYRKLIHDNANLVFWKPRIFYWLLFWRTEAAIQKCSEEKVFYSKLTGEQPCRSAISVKLLCDIIKITLCHGCSPVNLLHISRRPFPNNNSDRCFLRRYKTLFVHTNICIRNFVWCYFEDDRNYLYPYFFVLLQNLPKDIVPIVPI